MAFSFGAGSALDAYSEIQDSKIAVKLDCNHIEELPDGGF